MSDQTTLDLTEKQPTALMRLEAILKEMYISNTYGDDYKEGVNWGISQVLTALNDIKPSELADLKQAFCEGGIETQSAETWSKKWGQIQPNQP
jgi:hypothetical protein